MWGSGASPILPQSLAHHLSTVPLPADLRRLVPEIEGPTVADIKDLCWDAVPQADRERVADAVVRIVSRHIPRIEGSKLLAAWPAEVSPSVMHWSKRVSNILRRSDLMDDPVRLASLDTDDLLCIRSLGVKSLIELVSGLDQLTPALMAEAVLSSTISSLSSIPAWGEKGAPILPEQVRERRKDESLPGWLLHELALPQGSTYLSLDSSVWNRARNLSSRVETFALRVLQEELPHLSEYTVLLDEWPEHIPPRKVPWKPRVFNCLESVGLFDDIERLSRITFGELTQVRSMGLKSILDFTVTSETLIAASIQPSEANVREVLLEYGDALWLDRISRSDSRFRDLIPAELGEPLSQILDRMEGAYGRRTARVLRDVLPRIRERLADIENQPLDVALDDFFTRYTNSRRDLDLILLRFGLLRGGLPATLEAVGKELGITRERVRQIESKIIDRFPSHPIFMPQLEVTLRRLSELAPISMSDAGETLVREGLATRPLSPQGLAKLAQMFQYDIDLSVETVNGIRILNAVRSTELTSLLQLARAAAGRYGAYNVEDLTARLPFDCSSSEARDLLTRFSTTDFLADTWFWVPDIPRGRERLRNVTRKILSVSDPIDVTTLRAGIRRLYKWRRVEIVPPTEILRAYYAAHPEFEIDGRGLVSSVGSLNFRNELADVEKKLVEIFEESATGVLDRHSLEQAARERHLNPNSLSVFTTYSPIIDHPALNAWTLRGRQIDPSAIEAVRSLAATRDREKRALSYGWNDDGRLSIALRVGNINSPVFGIPAPVRPYIADRSFRALTEDGSDAGTIVVSPEGTSWGYGPFLRRKGGDIGDVLLLSFDLSTGDVVLSLEDDLFLET